VRRHGDGIARVILFYTYVKIFDTRGIAIRHVTIADSIRHHPDTARFSVFEVEPPPSSSDRSVAKGVSRPERNPTWYDTTGILRPTDSRIYKYR